MTEREMRGSSTKTTHTHSQINPWAVHKVITNLSPLPPISDPRIAGGKPVPCYDAAGDIDTLDGWNAYAQEQNAHAFRTLKGREPGSDAEVEAWVQRYMVNQLCATAEMEGTV